MCAVWPAWSLDLVCLCLGTPSAVAGDKRAGAALDADGGKHHRHDSEHARCGQPAGKDEVTGRKLMNVPSVIVHFICRGLFCLASGDLLCLTCGFSRFAALELG